jgi:hypothetical protein
VKEQTSQLLSFASGTLIGTSLGTLLQFHEVTKPPQVLSEFIRESLVKETQGKTHHVLRYLLHSRYLSDRIVPDVLHHTRTPAALALDTLDDLLIVAVGADIVLFLIT